MVELSYPPPNVVLDIVLEVVLKIQFNPSIKIKDNMYDVIMANKRFGHVSFINK